MLLVIESTICLVPEGKVRGQVLWDVCPLVTCFSLGVTTTISALELLSDVVEGTAAGSEAKALVVNC